MLLQNNLTFGIGTEMWFYHKIGCPKKYFTKYSKTQIL